MHIEDCLIVNFDYSPPDIPTLTVSRKMNDKIMVLNTFQGIDAVETYKNLTEKTTTNFEKIQSMSSTQMAEFLMSDWFTKNVCKNCEGEYDKCGDGKFCESQILKWLLSKKK